MIEKFRSAAWPMGLTMARCAINPAWSMSSRFGQDGPHASRDATTHDPGMGVMDPRRSGGRAARRPAWPSPTSLGRLAATASRRAARARRERNRWPYRYLAARQPGAVLPTRRGTIRFGEVPHGSATPSNIAPYRVAAPTARILPWATTRSPAAGTARTAAIGEEQRSQPMRKGRAPGSAGRRLAILGGQRGATFLSDWPWPAYGGPDQRVAEVFADPQVVARGLRIDRGGIPGVASPVVIDGRRQVSDRPSPPLAATRPAESTS